MKQTAIKYLVRCFCVSIIFLYSTDSFSQELLKQDSSNALPPPIIASHDTAISGSRVAASVAGIAGAITALHIYQYHAWWANQRTTFHVIEDPSYQADFDKAGHIFGAYYSSHFFDEAFRWTGMDSAQSTLFGALSGAIWEYYVEIEDGFARDWGFSRGDAKADLVGATFYLLRNRIPFLRNLNYKWSYVPSEKYLQNRPDIPGQTLNFIEDYGGQSYYLTADIHGMLPINLKSYWPSWLNLALGVGGYDIDTYIKTGNPFILRKKAWYISLDYDIEKIFPESDIPVLNFLRRTFNYWHFPAPAYRFYPNPRFYILFPFQMSIG